MSAFDILLRTCERNKDLFSWLEILKKARIFNVDQTLGVTFVKETEETATMSSPMNIPVEEDGMALRLFLPFPTTALVFTDSCTVFRATTIGDYAYLFITYAHVKLSDGRESDVIAAGALNYFPGEDRIAGQAVHGYVIRPNNKIKGVFSRVATGQLEGEQAAFAQLAHVAYRWLHKLNTIDRFILEVVPVQLRQHSSKYNLKSHQRPEYIILHPNEIRKLMKTESDIEGHKKAGHERRAHLRRYPDDKERWPNMHGKVIKIEAVWIGRTEAIVGDKQYRVILD